MTLRPDPERPKLTLASLSVAPCDTFVESLYGIWEHSPWIAARTWDARPFATVDDLQRAMTRVVEMATADEQLGLIRAHPELAGTAASEGTLTNESHDEQIGAGLDRCTPDELTRLTTLNSAYREKFAFPFVIAVRGHTRTTIIAALERRLGRDLASEHAEALSQIALIASGRLRDRIVGGG